MNLFLTFLLIIGVSFKIIPQDRENFFNNLSLENELEVSGVRTMFQDSRGYLWIGAESGLYIYNGFKIEKFKQSFKDKKAVSHVYVNSIYEDREGIIWISTIGGLNAFDPLKREFTKFYKIKNSKNSLNHNAATYISQDNDGNIWVATQYGLNKIDKINNKISSYIPDGKDTDVRLSVNILKKIIIDKHGLLWILAESCLLKFDPALEKFEFYREFGFYGDSLFEKENDSLLIITNRNNSLCYFNVKTKKLEKTLNVSSLVDKTWGKEVTALLKTREGTLWVATGIGLFIKEKNNNNFEYLSFKEFEKHGFRITRITSIFEDRSGVIWLGNPSYGLLKYSKYIKKFKLLKKDKNNLLRLSDDFARGIMKDDENNLWIATQYGGLNRISESGENRCFTFRSRSKPQAEMKTVWSVFQDRNKDIWAGTMGSGLYRFCKEKQAFELFSYVVDTAGIIVISEDRKGNLLLGTDGNGLISISPDRKSAFSVPLEVDGSGFKSIEDIFCDQEGKIWIGTNDGLMNYKPDKKIFSKFFLPKENDSESELIICCVSSCKDNYLWAASKGEGVYIINPSNNKVINIRTRDGLPHNEVYGILEDNSGFIWLSGGDGLLRVDKKNKSMIKFTTDDGLQGKEFNRRSFFKDKNGLLYFGGVSGVNIIDPDNYPKNLTPPLINITSVSIRGNKKYLNVSEKEALELTYEENTLVFEFFQTDFNIPKKNKYKFRLYGFEPSWNYENNVSEAKYYNIPPGEYLFTVSGANHDGIWSKKNASIQIIIRPPFWETVYFRILVVVFVAAVLYGIYKYRLKKALEIERIRVRIASNLHDEIGSSLAKISMKSEIISGLEKTSDIQTELSKIGDLSRKTIVSFSDIIWSIDARRDNMRSLVNRMKDFCIELLNEKGITIHFEEYGLESDFSIAPRVRQNVYYILKEAVTNILKHSNATDVRIIADNREDFVLKIEDNGAPSNSIIDFKGNGLSNMKMRAKELKGELEIKNEGGFAITLKCKVR